MAYDGIVISSIIKDIRDKCLGGRVLKIQQPGNDTLALVIKGFNGQTKLYMSVSASLPIVYIADTLPVAPQQAPAFCMLLRKHLGNGRLVRVEQPGFDRVFDLVFEHLDEMGDLAERHLIVEIMGRQSNIILTDGDMKIIDCMRRVLPDISSVLDGSASSQSENEIRILYPGKIYTPADSQGKIDPTAGFDRNRFETRIVSRKGPVVKAIFSTFTGFSKGIAEELVYRAGIDGRTDFDAISVEEKDRLFDVINNVINDIKDGNYKPSIGYLNGLPKDYHALELTGYDDRRVYEGDSVDSTGAVSCLLRDYYREKQIQVNVKSKSSDLRKVLNSSIERAVKKYDIQHQQLESTEDRDKYRIYGELLNTYGYELKGGEDHLSCINYYDNSEVTIPLEKELSAQENSQKYFAKYNKKKRTFEALTGFIKKTAEERDYLMSVRHSLDIAETDSDIAMIRKELEDFGVLKKQGKSKGQRKTVAGKPFHYISSDGYDIYVGRNNIQNDEMTFGFADAKDIWFHAKNMPGSHVIVKRRSTDETFDSIPDRVFEEAAALAAFYSSGSNAPKVEVDYTERKNLKKPPSANPGYVIYHTNYSIMAVPDIKLLKREED